jgi:hypothetical protein
MKKITALVLVCLMIISAGAINGFADEVKLEITVDGREISFNHLLAFIENDRTLVPARAFLNELGIQDEAIIFDAGKVTVKSVKELVFTVDSNIVLSDGEEKILDASAKIVNESLFVPLRFLCEELGCTVNFYGVSELNPNRNLVEIKTPAGPALRIFLQEGALDNNTLPLLEVAAAVTYTTNVTAVVAEKESVNEKMMLMLAAGEPVMILDDGFVGSEGFAELNKIGILADITEEIKKYSPACYEWIMSDEVIRAQVSGEDGKIYAYPVDNNGKIEKFLISYTANKDKAVTLAHGYREVVKGFQGVEIPAE